MFCLVSIKGPLLTAFSWLCFQLLAKKGKEKKIKDKIMLFFILGKQQKNPFVSQNCGTLINRE